MLVGSVWLGREDVGKGEGTTQSGLALKVSATFWFTKAARISVLCSNTQFYLVL